MRTDDAAIEVMRESGAKLIWRGHIDAMHDIAERAGHVQSHPVNVAATVMREIAKSKKFLRAGAIKALGRTYPVFEIAPPNDQI